MDTFRRKGSKRGTVKLLEPTNLEALQFAPREVKGPSMFEDRHDKSERKVDTHSNDEPSQKRGGLFGMLHVRKSS
jgi:hypothetical protein